MASAGIPVWISWLKYLSFVFYGFNLLLHYEYQGRTIYSCVEPQAAMSTASSMTVQVRAHAPAVYLSPLLSSRKPVQLAGCKIGAS
jgi:hypothetical protein